MTRADAAKMLGQLLAVDAIGALLDTVGSTDLRDVIGKAQIMCRAIAVDEESAAAIAVAVPRAMANRH